MLGFNVVCDAIGGLNVLNTYRPLQLLGGAADLEGFSHEQLEGMAQLSLNTLAPAFIGELSFAVWLTVKGVNVTRWQEQTRRSTASL